MPFQIRSSVALAAEKRLRELGDGELDKEMRNNPSPCTVEQRLAAVRHADRAFTRRYLLALLSSSLDEADTNICLLK